VNIEAILFPVMTFRTQSCWHTSTVQPTLEKKSYQLELKTSQCMTACTGQEMGDLAEIHWHEEIETVNKYYTQC
jgi:hypothetical protein